MAGPENSETPEPVDEPTAESAATDRVVAEEDRAAADAAAGSPAGSAAESSTNPSAEPVAGTAGESSEEPSSDAESSDEPLPGAPAAPEPPAKPGSERPTEPTAATPTEGEGKKRWPPDWNRLGKKALIWLGVAAALVALYFLLASFLPRWWAQRMGDLVGGSFALGVWWGLFIGALFTAVPIMVGWLAFRRAMPWRLRLVVVGVAILLAAPNLMTLSVVAGTRAAAHAGERILDVEAPAFRGATLAGALIGAVIAAGLIILLSSYKRRGRKIKQLEGDRPGKG